MKALNIFIGYDKAEPAAYQVCSYSILKNASKPVAIHPLNIRHLPDFTNNDYKSSTDFAFTRFLVPWLCDYEGYAVFMDSDMLVRDDIHKILESVEEGFDVYCVKHNYSPKMGDKFLGAEQTAYNKKNWSSVMLFNNANCKALTFDYVNSAKGLDLHQFRWTDSIGSLPNTWNYLVGEHTERNSNPAIAHFTRGGPYFKDYEFCEFSDEWFKYYAESCSVLDTRIVEVKNV